MLTKIKVNCLVVVVNPFPWRLKLAVLVRILCPACPEVVSSSLPPIPSLNRCLKKIKIKTKKKTKKKKKKLLPPSNPASLSHHRQPLPSKHTNMFITVKLGVLFNRLYWDSLKYNVKKLNIARIANAVQCHN